MVGRSRAKSAESDGMPVMAAGSVRRLCFAAEAQWDILTHIRASRTTSRLERQPRIWPSVAQKHRHKQGEQRGKPDARDPTRGALRLDHVDDVWRYERKQNCRRRE